MKRNPVTNKKTVVILLVVLVSVLVFALYIKPIEMNKRMFLCTTSGEKIMVKLDISIKRNVFAPDTLMGTLDVDGEEYVSIYSTNMNMEQGTIIERLAKKIKGERNFQYFILPTNSAEEAHQCMVQMKFGKEYDEVFLWLIQDGESKIYYGPAETKEEAQMIEIGDGI